MFSEHKGIELEINKRELSGKSPDMCKLNKSLLNNSRDEGEITGEIKK